jgi:hypothetical protein
LSHKHLEPRCDGIAFQNGKTCDSDATGRLYKDAPLGTAGARTSVTMGCGKQLVGPVLYAALRAWLKDPLLVDSPQSRIPTSGNTGQKRGTHLYFVTTFRDDGRLNSPPDPKQTQGRVTGRL